MAELQTHRPDELLLKEEPVHPKFQPGHMVGHGVDAQALGMVVARREDAGKVECDVLWSRVPTRQVVVPSPPPRRPVPVPTGATWKRTMHQEELRVDDAYLSRSFWAPGRIEERFDGEELFEPGALSPEEARFVCSVGRGAELTFHQDGYVSITRRDVPKHELPEYVSRNPPQYSWARYERGQQQRSW